MYVVKFEDLSKSDIRIAGGKGANLGELTQASIPVPLMRSCQRRPRIQLAANPNKREKAMM